MPKVRTNARAHQSPPSAAAQVEASLDDGTVALVLSVRRSSLTAPLQHVCRGWPT